MAFAAINTTSPNIAIEEAFAAEPSLKKRVYDAIGAYSERRIHAHAIGITLPTTH